MLDGILKVGPVLDMCMTSSIGTLRKSSSHLEVKRLRELLNEARQ